MKKSLVFFVIVTVFFSCRKEKEEVVFQDNTIPYFDQVPRILLENYVNRVFIDLIGREPTDVEMNTQVDLLRSTNASEPSRIALIQRLMFDTTQVPGDGSYREAYIRKFYEDQKGRFLEGASEGTLQDDYNLWKLLAYQDSLNGNMIGYEIFNNEASKMLAVINSRVQLQEDSIFFEEMCRRMMFNSLYDEINMNTFNFINATFDDSFGRFPTQSEYDAVEDAIEFNGSGQLFGQDVSSKVAYLNVLVGSAEFDEGFLRWAFKAYLAREATSSEVFTKVDLYRSGSNYSLLQQYILTTDEYAGFQ